MIHRHSNTKDITLDWLSLVYIGAAALALMLSALLMIIGGLL